MSGYGTSLEFYDLLTYINLGKCKYRLFEKADYKYGTSIQNAYEIVSFGNRIVYVSPCEYDSFSYSAKALLYNSENLIIGTTKSTTKYYFNMHLPSIKCIYYYGNDRLTEGAAEYYMKKGALTKSIKTPVSILD